MILALFWYRKKTWLHFLEILLNLILESSQIPSTFVHAYFLCSLILFIYKICSSGILSFFLFFFFFILTFIHLCFKVLLVPVSFTLSMLATYFVTKIPKALLLLDVSFYVLFLHSNTVQFKGSLNVIMRIGSVHQNIHSI